MIRNFFLVAYRNLVKNKAMSFLNVAGLAIGILVCLVIGVWLQRELSFDNFHPNGDKIFRIANTFKSETELFSQAGAGAAYGAHLTTEIPAIKATCRVFDEVSKVKSNDNLYIESNAAIVDSNFFNFFGFKLLKGEPGQVLRSLDQIVMTERLAVKYFGSVNNAMGKTVEIDGRHLMTVSGVAENVPANSQIQFDLLLPYSHLKKLMMTNYHFNPDSMWVGGWPFVYVQLNDPSNWKNAETQINRVAKKVFGKGMERK